MRPEQKGALALALAIGLFGSLWAGFGAGASVVVAALAGQLGFFYSLGLGNLRKEGAGHSKSEDLKQTSHQSLQTDSIEAVSPPEAVLRCDAETQVLADKSVDAWTLPDQPTLESTEVQAIPVMRSMAQATVPIEVKMISTQTSIRYLSIQAAGETCIDVSDIVILDEEFEPIEPVVYVSAQRSLHYSPQERDRCKDFKFDKEVIIHSLQCEKVVEEDTVSYSLSSQIEAQTHIPVEMFNSMDNQVSPIQPIFISLVNFSDEATAIANCRLFRDFFGNDQRFVKASSQTFQQVVNDNFLDSKDFQELYMSILLANISHTTIVLVDELGDTQKHWLRYHFKCKTGPKHLAVLHTKDLKQSAEAFTDVVWNELDDELPDIREEAGHYYDEALDIWHLRATERASFEFIEALLAKSLVVGFDPASSCFVNPSKQFKFEDYFCEAVVKTLQYMLLPVFNPALPQFVSEGHVQEYGYQAVAVYRNLPEMPWSVLIEPKPAQTIYINPLTLASQGLFSTMHVDTVPTSRPYCALFLSPCKANFEEIFGPQSLSTECVDVYAASPPVQSDFGDTQFDVLTTWVLGSYLSDYIVFVLDFNTDPYLDRSELFVKYLEFFKDIDKPLLFMHKSSAEHPFQESLKVANFLLSTANLADRIILHEELSASARENSEILRTVREQMKDNLGSFDGSYDLGQLFQKAFDLTVAKLLVVMNSRKREMLVRSQMIQLDEGFCTSVTLEPGWRCVIKESYMKSLPELIYVSPAYFEIDQRIYSEFKFKDEQPSWVKCAVLSNKSTDSLEVIKIAAQFCTQSINDSALLLPARPKDSESNHINTPEFNQLFMSSFMDRLGDCLMLILHYEGGKLVDPGDNFDVISKVIAKRLVRENKKPMIVVHLFDRSKDLDGLFSEFQSCANEVTQMFSEWSGMPRPAELLTHKQPNEGVYAFDKVNQVIHRAIAPGTPLGWRWYNCILYKIMHDSVLKLADRASFRSKIVQVFGELMREMLLIEDDESRVQPQVLYEGTVNERTLPQSVIDTVYCPFNPAWVVSHKA